MTREGLLSEQDFLPEAFELSRPLNFSVESRPQLTRELSLEAKLCLPDEDCF